MNRIQDRAIPGIELEGIGKKYGDRYAIFHPHVKKNFSNSFFLYFHSHLFFTPFAAGAIVCVLLTARLVFWLFQRYYAGMYHLIVGLVIGSSLALFPAVVFPAFTDTGLAAAGLSRGGAVTMAGAMLLAGTAFSYAFSRVEQRYAPDRAR